MSTIVFLVGFVDAVIFFSSIESFKYSIKLSEYGIKLLEDRNAKRNKNLSPGVSINMLNKGFQVFRKQNKRLE